MYEYIRALPEYVANFKDTLQIAFDIVRQMIGVK